jgi:hypothetical protein
MDNPLRADQRAVLALVGIRGDKESSIRFLQRCTRLAHLPDRL